MLLLIKLLTWSGLQTCETVFFQIGHFLHIYFGYLYSNAQKKQAALRQCTIKALVKVFHH